MLYLSYPICSSRQPSQADVIIYPQLMGEETGTERLSDLPKFTQQARVEAGRDVGVSILEARGTSPCRCS